MRGHALRIADAPACHVHRHQYGIDVLVEVESQLAG